MIEALTLPVIRSFPVEQGHIMQFARAIGDANPIYSDPGYAARSRLGGIIAPPTFSEASIHYDEGWRFRPRPGQPWLGSAATPSGVSAQDRPQGTMMHAETHFVYHRPLRPGMNLSVTGKRGRRWEKHGARSGRLQFSEVVAEFHDGDVPVLACTTVGVSTEHLVENTTPEPPSAQPAFPVLDMPADYPPPPLRASALRVGDRRDTVVGVNISRAQIIQYAGAVGDFSPQHVDEVYNTQVGGYPSVFAHGMLTMAMTGRMLTDWIGDGRLKTYGFQFRRQVWPGDSIIASAAITAITPGDDPAIDLAITTTNQHGSVLGRGYASATIES